MYHTKLSCAAIHQFLLDVQVLHMLDASFLAKQPSLWQPIMLQLLDKSMIVGHNCQLALTAASTLKQHAAKLLSGEILAAVALCSAMVCTPVCSSLFFQSWQTIVLMPACVKCTAALVL